MEASTKGRKEGTWRRTVPVARLRCQDKEEEETFRPQDFSGEEDRVRRLGMDCFSEAASTGTQEGGVLEKDRAGGTAAMQTVEEGRR